MLNSSSESIKVLNLAINQLTELNGKILFDYAKNNINIEHINLEKNDLVHAEHLANINKECNINM